MKNRAPHTKHTISDHELTKLQKASSALTDEFHTAVMLSAQCNLKSHHVRTICWRQIDLDEARLWSGPFGDTGNAERPLPEANKDPRRAGR